MLLLDHYHQSFVDAKFRYGGDVYHCRTEEPNIFGLISCTGTCQEPFANDQVIASSNAVDSSYKLVKPKVKYHKLGLLTNAKITEYLIAAEGDWENLELSIKNWNTVGSWK